MDGDSPSRLLDLLYACFAFNPDVTGGEDERFLAAAEDLRKWRRIPNRLPGDPRLPGHYTSLPPWKLITGVLFDTAMHLNALEREAEAIPFLDRLIEIDPSDAEAYGELGSAYRAMGKHERALACFTKKLDLVPDDAWAMCGCGDCHLKLGDIPRALDYFRAARGADPCHPSVQQRWNLLNSIGIR